MYGHMTTQRLSLLAHKIVLVKDTEIIIMAAWQCWKMWAVYGSMHHCTQTFATEGSTKIK